MGNLHYHKILKRLPQWWSKERDSETAHIIKSFSDEFDVFTIEINNLHKEIFVVTASGDRLDKLGRIFRIGRKPNETDDQFRARIIAYWPGFSGGGTISAIKSTINKITGVPEADINVVENIPPKIKFRTFITLDNTGEDELKNTISDTIWNIKAAGVYPFFTWILGGELLGENLSIQDTVDIKYITQLNWFVLESSLIDSNKLLW